MNTECFLLPIPIQEDTRFLGMTTLMPSFRDGIYWEDARGKGYCKCIAQTKTLAAAKEAARAGVAIKNPLVQSSCGS